MNVNFVFVRHGHGCHNAARPLYQSNTITKENTNIKADPELTSLGVDASIHNGCIIGKTLMNFRDMTGNNKMQIDRINIVGASPLIRSMETAYYMTRKWKNPPPKIFVFPHLRELDEQSHDKYSNASRNRMDTIPAYAMQSIKQQKQYLKKLGILNFFDFTFVEADEASRREPGDIVSFVKWLSTAFMPLMQFQTNNLNVFAVTHAGVLRDFSKRGYPNNSGFVLNTEKQESSLKLNSMISLEEYLPNTFFTDYEKYSSNSLNYYCPSQRCNGFCSKSKNKNLNHLQLSCKM
jgi:broad specificity phosphatase PhoE